LIRCKGIGIYFITQNPMDVPSGVLAQLGLKIQHALRAFTAKDRQSIKQTADNYPSSDYYETSEILTSLGIGEALVTALSEKGTPTPLVATMLRAPMSRMDILSESEIQEINTNSKLVKKYSELIDRESAYELLNKKIAQTEAEIAQKELDQVKEKEEVKATTSSSKQGPSTGEIVGKSVLKVLTSATFIRGALGILTKMMKRK
jgi:hypothetical protein